jgi:hypothetical protein
MKIFISMVITLVVLSVITVILIKKSVKTQNTKISWTALAQGNLTFNVTMNLLLPFAVTIEEFKITLGAGGVSYFQSEKDSLRLNPGLNVISFTFIPVTTLDALALAGLVTQKKYINIQGYVLGLSFMRTEDLSN